MPVSNYRHNSFADSSLTILREFPAILRLRHYGPSPEKLCQILTTRQIRFHICAIMTHPAGPACQLQAYYSEQVAIHSGRLARQMQMNT